MTERLGLAIAFIQFHQHSLLIVKKLLLSKVCFSCLFFHIYQNIVILNSLPLCVVLRGLSAVHTATDMKGLTFILQPPPESLLL